MNDYCIENDLPRIAEMATIENSMCKCDVHKQAIQEIIDLEAEWNENKFPPEELLLEAINIAKRTQEK